MKAVTLFQPWASAIAHGFKTLETRSWAPAYRGPLAIHAAAAVSHPNSVTAWNDRTAKNRALRGAGMSIPDTWPFGCIVAVCELADIVRTEDVPRALNRELASIEWVLGNFEPRRFAWVLYNVKRIAAPMPCRGGRRLWNLEEDVLREWIEAQGTVRP